MAHLADLLGHEHPLFVYNLAQLEKAAGDDSVDVQLIADINAKAHKAMRALGLDGSDIYPDELYQALNAAVRRGDADEILRDTTYALVIAEGEPVSLNIQDVIENMHHQLVFADRCLESARRHLRAEIVRRYADHDKTNNKIVKNLLKEAGIILEKDEGHRQLNQQIKENSMDQSTPHVLCVGDIITDAFIKLSEEYTDESTNKNGNKQIGFELGAKLPYDEVEIVEAVECSPNAAVSMSRLGLSTSLMSWLGDDEPGKGMVTYLDKEGVGTNDLVVEQGMKSNYHYVMRYKDDRTKLQRFEDYSYEWKAPARTPDWLYVGVLGEKTWPLHEAMLEYLNQNPNIKLAFQPGMYHLMWGAEKLAGFYKRAHVVIMNREEAVQVTNGDHASVSDLADKLHELGVDQAIITDGKDGAYASFDSRLVSMPNYPDIAPPYDRTGAGDAFASTLVAALALGQDMETALRWAPINSMNVVQQLGAQAGLQTRQQIEEWLEKAPSDYVLKEL